MIKTNYFTYTGNGEHGMTATEYGNAFDALMGRNGTLSADGTMLTYSIDNEVLQDITGTTGIVKGTFGGEHFGDNGASSFFEVKIS